MRYHRREQALDIGFQASGATGRKKEAKGKGQKASGELGKGFALVAALLATLIIMAVGILALFLTTRDIRVSYRMVAEKKTMAAAETGIHQLMTSFDPENLAASARTNIQADPSDASFRYSISTPTRPSGGPEIVPLAGYSMGGGQQWGQTRFTAEVTGENTLTGSKVQISIGLGYGPIEFTTMSR